MGFKTTIVHLLLAVHLGTAHPHGAEEKEFQHAAQPLYRRSLDHCAEAFAEPEFMRRTVERREATLRQLRKEQGIHDGPVLHGRQIDKVLKTNHRVNAKYNESTPASVLFKDSGACMLSPEVTEGPLYVRGEQIRRNVRDGQSGVKMTIDIQVVDVRTCLPIVNAAVDFWSCNSTGVYGGVLNYPGNGDPKDLGLINSSVLRGIQFTDAEGIATFDAHVPGHYAGRANHIHAIAHLGVTKLANNTITGGKAAHVGQMYFDQSLLEEVERVPPYSTNRQALTRNAQDQILAQGANGDDPVVRYTLIGNTVADGIFAWIRFGVDANANRRYNPAAYKDASGGHMANRPNTGFP